MISALRGRCPGPLDECGAGGPACRAGGGGYQEPPESGKRFAPPSLVAHSRGAKPSSSQRTVVRRRGGSPDGTGPRPGPVPGSRPVPCSRRTAPLSRTWPGGTRRGARGPTPRRTSSRTWTRWRKHRRWRAAPGAARATPGDGHGDAPGTQRRELGQSRCDSRKARSVSATWRYPCSPSTRPKWEWAPNGS
jgi:hypothetical protein